MSTTTHTSASATSNSGLNLYDGYATIRARGLYRQRSIRAASIETETTTEESSQQGPTTPRARRRTLSLKSNFSQCSTGTENPYACARDLAKPVHTPTVHDLEAPAYANYALNFRPLSDDSSSSGAGSHVAAVSCCQDHLSDGNSNNSARKSFRFSLDSLQSNATPKTSECEAATEEEEADTIFLYTAPKSPKRLFDNSLSPYYSPIPKQSFEMDDVIDASPLRRRLERTPSSISAQYRTAKAKIMMSNSFNYGERSDNSCYQSTGQIFNPNHSAPMAPVRRESLYASPKRSVTSQPSNSSTPLELSLSLSSKVGSQNGSDVGQRSSSVDMLERSQTSHSLATIDQDEILIVPTAMPVLQNAVDKRYHTLGHMRVQSLGASLHRAYEMPNYYYNFMSNQSTDLATKRANRSAGNIYSSADEAIADLNRLAPEYVDPLDFKIGCQTTLRCKPIIPWYELAIRRDFKRQSCPPINDSPVKKADSPLNTSNGIDNKEAHVVSAFEQSLSNMTSRLQHLTATAERKDGELTDMRQTIELLRKQSIQAGLTTAHMQSMGVQTQSQMDLGQHANANAAQMTKQLQSAEVNGTTTAGVMQRHHSSDSMCSLNSISSNCSTHDKIKKKKGWLRSSFTKAFSRNAKISKTSRHGAGGHYGSDSRMAGASPARSNGHHAIKEESINSNNTTAHSSVNGNHSVLNSSPAKTVTLIDNAKPIDAIETEDHPVVEDLKKQLREKDLVLTDIRLEALSSASQLESLKETVNKMRAEMLSLKQNNERLQKLVTSRSLAGSEISLGHAISPSGSVNESRRFSLADTTGRPPIELPKRLNEHIEEENIPPAPAPEPQQAMSPATHIDLTPPPPTLESLTNVSHLPLAEEMSDVTDGKKIAIACYLGQPESFRKYCEEMLETDTLYANSCILNENGEAEGTDMKSSFNVANLNEFVIAYTYISGKTTWQNLDYIVRKTFKDYVARIDPGTNLGLNTDSITSYHLGEAKRGPEMGFPELLPCGYIVGNVRNLYICLQGVGSLAFDSLIPRSIVHRYISLLTEHRRLILCGPSGTGKSYLARRLAEFLVARSVRGNPSEAIATFNVDHKSSKDLRQYLGHIAEQAAIANGASELPAIIILDNLHHASALGDIFSCLLSAGPAAKLPCIIGTMSQATCNTTNLQLHHNFRWVLTANHMEPVKGFLGRFLRRRLFQMELQTQKSQPELAAVLAWLPTVWQHINRFLEIHSSSDVTIGPRLFLTCPLDLKDSQIWFTDVWNYHLAPYLVEAVREGVQLYGRRGGPWNDPSIFIRNSYPWAYGADSVPPLRQIHAEDVGLEGVSGNNNDSQDPLLNMLMRLQEAANYSENQDPESDCASLDSNITPESSAGAE